MQEPTKINMRSASVDAVIMMLHGLLRMEGGCVGSAVGMYVWGTRSSEVCSHG